MLLSRRTRNRLFAAKSLPGRGKRGSRLEYMTLLRVTTVWSQAILSSHSRVAFVETIFLMRLAGRLARTKFRCGGVTRCLPVSIVFLVCSRSVWLCQALKQGNLQLTLSQSDTSVSIFFGAWCVAFLTLEDGSKSLDYIQNARGTGG